MVINLKLTMVIKYKPETHNGDKPDTQNGDESETHHGDKPDTHNGDKSYLIYTWLWSFDRSDQDLFPRQQS